jgi:peptidoglycan/LPS O-acetylase OafA/YrhL
MSNNPHNSADTDQINPTSMKTNANTLSISVDLTWIDMLKGIAIIGVFFDNWTGYMKFDTTPALLYSLARIFSLAVGPFVQVFFILSGFGLTIAYFKQSKTNWSWKRWTWRRITKIVMPYAIFVIFSFVLGILGSYLYTSIDMQFSWVSLLSYLTFTRNFYPPSWIWNPPLWFMPVIIGLYISFPILIKTLEKWGPWVLLLISAFVTYGTLAIAVLADATGSHAGDLFTFWMIQFALGMVLAHVREAVPQKLGHLIDPKAFFLGLGLMMCSWVLRTYVPLGKTFNDSVTSVGFFLILLNLGWTSRAKIPATGKVLNALSSKSYLMYLIHYPIMMFLIGPSLRVLTNPIIVIALGSIYIIAIFFLCHFISQPIGKFTSWAYHKYWTSS